MSSLPHAYPSTVATPDKAERPTSRWTAYGLAAAAAMLGVAARLPLDGVLGPEGLYLFYVPALLFSAGVGGAGPTVLAGAIGLTAGWAILGRDGLDRVDMAQMVLYAVLTAGVAAAGERLQRMRAQIDRTTLELYRREAHLQSILATVPDAMIVIDERGIMRSFSTAAERLFGWSAEEAIGRNVAMLMPAPYREEHDSYLHHYLDGGERKVIGIGRVVVGERRDGSTFPIELAIGEMVSSGQRFFTGFVRDLSERQQTEARLQELQSELVHISRLTALGEMASTLAHELNQPLSAIANYLKGSRRLLAAEDVDRERLSDALGKAGDQALRAGQIIRRLREFVARGETERKVEHLPKLIEEAAALALVGVKEHGVRVRLAIDPKVELVLAERVPIQQVVLNLIRNAIDAMEGCDRRELRVATAAVGDEMAQVSVADTGPGVSHEVVEQLFNPFVTTKAHGMGVGLSISRTIVEAHGGRIWVEPNPGGGAVFNFTLRMAPREESADGR